MSEPPVRWAIVGNGFARQVVLPCLRLVPRVRVAALCSRNAERARETAEEFQIPEVFTDYRSMIASAEPDLVLVTAPPHLHGEISVFALENGCHVLCEKPTALNSGQAARMLDAARAAGDRLHLIDHELRFDPARRKIRELIAGGWVGRVRHGSWTHRSAGYADPARPFTWWHERSKGGGLLGAVGSHAVDLFRYWIGEFDQALGDLRIQVPLRNDPAAGSPREVETDDAFTALLRLRDGSERVEPGATVALDMSVAAPGPWVTRIEVLGSEGSLYLDEAGTLWGSKSGATTWETIAVKEDDVSKKDRELIPDTVWARSFLRYARRISEAMAAASPSVPDAATFEDGLRVQEVLDAVRASNASGGWTKVAAATGKGPAVRGA